MNRTLLLILCDFLLLNLLALTNWESAEPARTPPAPVAADADAGATTADQDLVEVMRLALEDEQAQQDALAAQRSELAAQLEATTSTLAEREQNLAGLAAERDRLSTTLSQTEQTAAELARQAEAAAREATMSQERLAQLQRDLEQREAEAARQREQIDALAREQAEARQRIESLNVAVRVAEQEKVMLRETADVFRQQAESEREQRIRVQETTTELAQGVGQLAERSADLSREIRENRPVNVNVLFSDFMANRVQTSFAVMRQAPLGPLNRGAEARTVFVSDGDAIYALLHIEDTPFTLREIHNWERVGAAFTKGMYRTTVPAMNFLQLDPRIVALPVDAAQVAALGVKVYELAADPFRFPDAVLIANGGTGYGEVPFKLDPGHPAYVQMDNRLVRRLFGDFSPSRGDLVLSRSGELLGIMVNSNYCVIVNNLAPGRTLNTGDTSAQRTSELFNDLVARVRRLPSRLQ